MKRMAAMLAVERGLPIMARLLVFYRYYVRC
jgi:hypothetical protein